MKPQYIGDAGVVYEVVVHANDTDYRYFGYQIAGTDAVIVNTDIKDYKLAVTTLIDEYADSKRLRAFKA